MIESALLARSTAETDYDQLLAQGFDRGEARAAIERVVERMLFDWDG
jgi:hypothetical protein